MNETIKKRQSQQKKELLELFMKTPIIQIACEKAGISRATYYRWRIQSKTFAAAADAALAQGVQLVNDLAESQLISEIREKKMPAIAFWLRHRHPQYTTRVELTTQKPPVTHELSPEEKRLLRRAIALAALPEDEEEES